MAINNPIAIRNINKPVYDFDIVEIERIGDSISNSDVLGIIVK